MNIRRRAVAVIAALGLGAALPLTTATTAQAATPYCVTTAWVNGQAAPASAGLSPNCVMFQGAHSEAVRTLQWSLNICYGKGLSTDADFGPRTRQALVEVQQLHHIRDDGGYGPQTARTMKHYGFDGRPCGNIYF
jgi:peptidoglycan hydrolase-like protein with peptidoglycan-binding domain